MPKLEAYHKGLPYSYAPGLFPAAGCLESRPDLCLRLLLHTRAKGSEGAMALLSRAEAAGIRVEWADRAIERIARKENVFAAMVFQKQETPLDESRPHIVLVEPSDLGNLGTILRTCLGFDLPDIAVIQPAADVFDPRAVRASMGALFSMRLSTFESFDQYRAAYPGHALYPFMLQGALPLGEVSPGRDAPWALVFGNEARGLPEGFAALGQAVRIEQSPAVDSLNLAVAVALGAYRFVHCPKES